MENKPFIQTTCCVMTPILFSDMTEFTDEEGYGKYLDIHECYEKYINLKGVDVSICFFNLCMSPTHQL